MVASPNSNATLLIVLEAQSQKLQNSLVQVNKNIDAFAAATERRFAQMNATNAASFDKLGSQIKGSLSGVTQLLGAIGLTAGIKQVIDYANTWQTLENRLKSASTYSGVQARSLNDLTDAALAARTPLNDYVVLYTRMLNTAGALGLTEQQVATTTDLVAKAFKVGGASAQEQAAGITQITQALSAGIVQGQDLRAIKNDAPVVAQALASYFNTTVGGLKKLGAEGKITSADLVKAMFDYRDKIEGAFKSTQSTITDAIANIGTAFTQYVGTQGEASGATQKLVDSLNFLATNFKTIAPIVLDFLAIVGGALAANALAGFVGGISAAVAALGTFLGALGTGGIGVVALAEVIAPVILIAGAAAAAFYLLNNASSDLSGKLSDLSGDVKTNADKIDIAREASEKYRKALNDQLNTQVLAAKAALAEAQAQLAAAQSKAQAAGIMTSLFGMAGEMLGGKDSPTLKGLNPDDVADSITNPAQAAVDQAQKNLNDLSAQQKTASWFTYMTPGTKDTDLPSGNGGDTGGSADKKNAYDRATASIQKQTDALTAQTAAQAKLNPFVDDYGFAEDKAKASSDLLSAAQQAGIKVTPELRQSIDQLATSYASADAASKALAESQQELVQKAEAWRDTIKDATNGFIQDLINGKTAAEALGDALTNIGNQLINMGLDSLFGGGTFGSKSSPFGLIGQALGIGGSSGPSGGLAWAGLNAKGGIASHGKNIPVFASGGISQTAAIFGEAGPEAAVPLPDGRSIPVTLSMPKPANDNGAVHVTYAPQIDARGADSSAVAALARAQAQDRAEFSAKVVGAVRAAKKARAL